jgi:hypothetical protein
MATFPQNGVQYAPNAGADPAVVPLTIGSPVSVTTTATSIATVPANGTPIMLVNSSTEIVYLGDAGVTTSTGYALAASAAVMLTYGPPSPQIGGATCALYGITSTGSSNVTPYSVTAWPGANLY